jgi:hypothetical protein
MVYIMVLEEVEEVPLQMELTQVLVVMELVG